MTLDEDIAYWTKCMQGHPSKDASIVAFCVATGLKFAKADHIEPYRQALRDCQTLTPSLMAGEDAIERLKQINSYVYKVLGR